MTNPYGIIATETGVDVSNSPDYRRILDSNWPVLEVAFEQTFHQSVTVTAGANLQKIYSHNLGFAPAYTYIDVSGYSGLGVGYPTNNLDTFFIIVDKENVYINVPASSNYTFTISGFLRIYNYDPSIKFQAPVYPPSDPKSQDGDYGIASLINSFDGDIAGVDFSKFSINSRAKSLTIHQSGIADASSGSFTITHNLNYQPSFMIFQISGNYYYDQAPVRSYGDQNSLTFNGIQNPLAGNYAYIIFKDPILQQQI